MSERAIRETGGAGCWFGEVDPVAASLGFLIRESLGERGIEILGDFLTLLVNCKLEVTMVIMEMMLDCIIIMQPAM